MLATIGRFPELNLVASEGYNTGNSGKGQASIRGSIGFSGTY